MTEKIFNVLTLIFSAGFVIAQASGEEAKPDEAPLSKVVVVFENRKNGGALTANEGGTITLNTNDQKTSQEFIVEPIDANQFISRGAIVKIRSRKFDQFLSPENWAQDRYRWQGGNEWVGYQVVLWPRQDFFKITQVEGTYLKIEYAGDPGYPKNQCLESHPTHPEHVNFWSNRVTEGRLWPEQQWILRVVN